MKKALHMVLLLLLAVSCGPRVIDADDMEEIMYQVLIQDQQIKQDYTLKAQADTSLVYAGIFDSFGYDTEDFLHSMEYYLEDPAKFEKIMESVAERLEREERVAHKELDLERWREKMMRIFHMPVDTTWPHPRPRPVDTLPLRFTGDTMHLELAPDSLPQYPKDSLWLIRDSLLLVRDSLKIELDSLATVRDSL